MRRLSVDRFRAVSFAVVAVLALTVAEASPQSAAGIAPTLIPLSGQIASAATGSPQTVSVMISLYDYENDPAPRWIEQQTVTLDATGGYTLQFGATLPEGLPLDVFTGDPGPRWIGVKIATSPDPDQPRRMLISVPYAARAASAETLGGKPVSDFVMTSTFRDDLLEVLEEEGVKTASSGGVSTTATTAGNLAKFLNSSGALEDSALFDNSGRIGLGTSTPNNLFDVGTSAAGANGDIRIRHNDNSNPNSHAVIISQVGGPNGGDPFSQYSVAAGAVFSFGIDNSDGDKFKISNNVTLGTNDRLTIDAFGNVGIGTASPGRRLQVDGQDPGIRLRNIGSGNQSWLFGNGLLASNDGRFSIYDETNGGARLVIDTTGNVGVGVTTPDAKLHVAGSAIITGDVTVNGNIAAKYQDVAEWVDADEPLDAGTVVVIDTTATNRVSAVGSAYDTRVAGAVSPQPGLILGEAGEGRVLVAQSGRVRIKADARFGAIRPGDLLVSSPTKGHAMRADSKKVRPGNVIGKALEALPDGRGYVLALLTLQ